jgi:large subunit ribosomal protein L19
MNILEKIQSENLKKTLPDFKVGNTVRVHVKVKEKEVEKGKEKERERVQVYEGVVIRTKGHGVEKTFTVRKVSYGIGVERVFPMHSPIIDKVEIASRGRVRRAKLYYLRGLSGKKARLDAQEGFHPVAETPKETTGTPAA